MKIYKLSSHNLKLNCNNETQYFTSYKKAKQSMFELINYLNWNHRLNVDNKEDYSLHKDVESTILDNSYNVSLTKYETNDRILTYK